MQTADNAGAPVGSSFQGKGEEKKAKKTEDRALDNLYFRFCDELEVSRDGRGRKNDGGSDDNEGTVSPNDGKKKGKLKPGMYQHDAYSPGKFTAQMLAYANKDFLWAEE